jgi:hypothetical protein
MDCECEYYGFTKINSESEECVNCHSIRSIQEIKVFSTMSSILRVNGPSKHIKSDLFHTLSETDVIKIKTNNVFKQLLKYNEVFVKTYPVKEGLPADILLETAQHYVLNTDTIKRGSSKILDLSGILHMVLVKHNLFKNKNDIKLFFGIKKNILPSIRQHDISISDEIKSIVDCTFKQMLICNFDSSLKHKSAALALYIKHNDIISSQFTSTITYGSIWNIINRTPDSKIRFTVEEFIKIIQYSVNVITLTTYIKNTIIYHEKLEPVYVSLGVESGVFVL